MGSYSLKGVARPYARPEYNCETPGRVSNGDEYCNLPMLPCRSTTEQRPYCNFQRRKSVDARRRLFSLEVQATGLLYASVRKHQTHISHLTHLHNPAYPSGVNKLALAWHESSASKHLRPRCFVPHRKPQAIQTPGWALYANTHHEPADANCRKPRHANPCSARPPSLMDSRSLTAPAIHARHCGPWRAPLHLRRRAKALRTEISFL